MRTLSNNRLSKSHSKMRGWVDATPSLLLLVVLVVYPLLSLLLQTVMPHLFDYNASYTISLQPLIQVFHDKLNSEAVGNSFVIGILAALTATILGTVTAYGASKAPKWLKLPIDAGVWIVFFAPSYVVAEGWVILMQDGGVLAQLFGLHNGWSSWFFSRFGLVFAMGLRYFPFVHMAMVQAIQNLGSELSSAARMVGATPRQVFWKVTLPLLTPAWLAGASISFAEGFGDFGFAAAITPESHIPLITYQIYSALNQAPVDYSSAAGLSLLVVVVTAVTLWLQFWWIRRKSYITVSSQTKKESATHRRMPHATTWGAYGLLLIALALPTGATICASLWTRFANGIQASNWTFLHYRDALQFGGDGITALSRSVRYAIVSAIITAAVGLYVAYQMSFRKSLANRVLNIVTMSTIAVPGVVMAAGFVFAWNAVWLIPLHLVLYGTPICLGMAYIAGQLPYSIRLQLGAMTQLSPNLLTAAQVLGAKRWRILWRIVRPLVQATTVSTFFMTFTSTVFELPATSLLYPAGEPPFPMLIDQRFNAFEWEQGSALSVVGMIFVLCFYAIGRYIVYRTEQKRIPVPDSHADFNAHIEPDTLRVSYE